MNKRTLKEKALEQTLIALDYQKQVKELNTKRQSRDGVVVTPIEIVDFQIRSNIFMIKNEYDREPDENIDWLDPFGGTGIYTARLLQIADLSPCRKMKLAMNCTVIEIDKTAAQIAANNLAKVIKEEIGINGYLRVLCMDSFATTESKDFFCPSGNGGIDYKSKEALKFLVKPDLPL